MTIERDRYLEVAAYRPGEPCPCGCDQTASKLSLRTGHVVGCACRPCTGRRSQKKGKAAQRKTHQNLGGQGFTPSNEESARPYTVEVVLMPEVKTGGQVPASWDKLIGTDWFRRAMSQSERAVPIGSGAYPCVAIRGDYVIVDIRKGRG